MAILYIGLHGKMRKKKMKAYKPDMYCTGRNFSNEYLEKKKKMNEILNAQVTNFTLAIERYIELHPEVLEELEKRDKEYKENKDSVLDKVKEVSQLL